ncbi:SEC-C domain-containing protein [Bacillus sp. T3]|uniref:SEC-C domain-containing protein n=1 Tax=Bacillus sp. T3 TaxID=467262 RepID=UPI0029824D19|nr:SEC-C domain-containing protein [Bacillus sp. T3]
MSVNRNDACPCGSGKKYKKCCLNKKKVIQIQEVKEERFFQQKNALVDRMRVFFQSNISRDHFRQLEREFHIRTNRLVPADIRDGFFRFWLYFCHRFTNGLRGIEWFYQEQQFRLSHEEKMMANHWTGLKMKLVEAVNKDGNKVVFEDMLSKDQYTVPEIRENIPAFSPWYGTLGLIESFEGNDYFNGVRIFKGPIHLMNALELVRQLAQKENTPADKILFDYYPEILAVLLGNDYAQKPEDKTEQEIHQYILEYHILNEVLLHSFLQENKDFIVDKADSSLKGYSWAGNWREYQDSEIADEVVIAEVFATLSIQQNKLIITSFDKKKTEQLKEILKKAILALQFDSERTNVIKSPIQAQIKNYFVQMSQDAPFYYSNYAQTNLFEEINVSIPKYNNRSIRQLIEDGEVELALSWLKQVEQNIYQQVMKQTDEIKVTADLNSVRKILGLPLSPFVTGGASRKSGFIEIENPFKAIIVEREDIPFYEDLGFTPTTISNFYATDMVTFFKEKTIGKGEGTVRKYRNSLYFLREVLEQSSLQEWSQCNDALWRSILLEVFASDEVSKTYQKDFVSTMKAFAKWLDSIKQTSVSSVLLPEIKKVELKITNKKVLQKI